MLAPSRDFLVLKHVLKTSPSLATEAGEFERLNMDDLCDRKIEEDKTDSMS